VISCDIRDFPSVSISFHMLKSVDVYGGVSDIRLLDRYRGQREGSLPMLVSLRATMQQAVVSTALVHQNVLMPVR
jgi:hypothetical protein